MPAQALLLVQQQIENTPINLLLEATAQFRRVGGLSLPDNITDLDLAALIAAMGITIDSDQWSTGDLALWMRSHRYLGEIPELEMARLAQFLKVGSPKTLYNRMCTCSAWPQQERVTGVPKISYSHHAILNSLPRERRLDLIARAATDGLTVHELTMMAIGVYADNERATQPAPWQRPPARFWSSLLEAHVQIEVPRRDTLNLIVGSVQYEITAVLHGGLPVLEFHASEQIPF